MNTTSQHRQHGSAPSGNSTAAGTSEPAVTGGAEATRRRVISASNILVALLTLGALAWGGWWLVDRLTHIYVLDARIASEMVLLSSRVPGWVVDIPVTESQTVSPGQVLVRIDDRGARAELAEVEAAVDVLSAGIETLDARIALVQQRTASHLHAAEAALDAALSEQKAAAGDLEIVSADWQRAERLRERNLISEQAFEASRNQFRNAQQNGRQRQAQVASARAAVEEVAAEREELRVLRAEREQTLREREKAEHAAARVRAALEDHTVTSPAAGIVDELFVDPGEYVAAGQRMLLMHDPRRQWVKANVKETDLRHFGEGDQVEVIVDAFPDDFHTGHIRRISHAATSQSALLPNPNPSGNFTKITQRIEVTVDLDAADPRLRPGMMVELKIPRR